MRKTVRSLAYSFVFASFYFLASFSQAHAAVSLVQSKPGDNNFGGSSYSSSFSSNTAAGDTIAVVIQWYNGAGSAAGSVTSVTDSQGNSYALSPASLAAAVTSGYARMGAQVAYATAIAGGADTINVNWDQSGSGFVSIYELSPSVFDAAVSAATTGSNPSAGSITTASNGEFLLAAVLGQTNGVPGYFTAGSGWTISTNFGGGGASEGIEYQAQASAGSVSGGFTSGSLSYAASLAAFKPSAGGGGSQSSDTTAPTTPSGLSASAVSSSAVSLSWTASTDAVGVTGYKIYRNGSQITTVSTNSYSDSGLSPSTAYSYTVSAYDAAGNNSAQSSSANATTQTGSQSSDTTPPTISSVSSGSLTSSGATIAWSTNESADSQVEYGLTSSYGNSTSLDSSLVTSHSASLSSLSANTQYHYRVKSKDAAGNLATGADNAFTTGVAQTGGSCGTTWYVDASVSSSGNGCSWATAWKSVTNIAGIKAGDTVYISGGSSGSSLTYNIPGTWTAVVSGSSASSRITYQIGQDSAHNGTAIFNSTGSGDWISGPSNITVSGNTGDGQKHFKLTNYGGVFEGTNIVNDRLMYIDFGNVGIDNWRVMDIRGANGIEIDHISAKITQMTADAFAYGDFAGTTWDQNSFHDSTVLVPNSGSGTGPDVLQGFGTAVSIYNNVFTGYLAAYTGGQHQDGWQSTGGGVGYTKIYNNTFRDIANYPVFGDGYYGGFNHLWVYNNLLFLDTIGLEDSDPPAGIVIGVDGGALLATTPFNDVVLANNTVVDYVYGCDQSLPCGQGRSSVGLSNITSHAATFTNDYVVNNLAINSGVAGFNSPTGAAGVTVSNNAAFIPPAQAAGKFSHYALNDLSNDPHLLAAATTLINTGTNMSAFFSTDKDGNARGSSWDIGAYEYTGGGTVTPPSDTTAPSIPTGLSSASVAQTGFTLNWTASTDAVGVTGYKIYQGGAQIGTATTNSYAVTGLTAATAYSFTVAAYDAAGNMSNQSSALSVTTAATGGGTSGAAIYVGQSAAGTADGSSCANEKAATFFNAAGSWGAGAAQIGPGKTVHFCGTISSSLTVQGSGVSGNPITFYFEPNAKLSMPVGTLMSMQNVNYIVIDGGTNGIMENTDNGTALGNHQAVSAIYASGSGNYEVKNLLIRNLYVHTSVADGSIDFTSNGAIYANTFGSNISIHDNVFHDICWIIIGSVTSGGSGFKVYNNDFYNYDHAIGGIGGAMAVPANVAIYNNHFGSTANWDTTANSYHHDGVHVYFGSGLLSGVDIYNNLFDGNWGSNNTGHLFLEGNWNHNDTASLNKFNIYNNVFVQYPGNTLNDGFIGGGGANFNVVNNTFLGASVTNSNCLGIGLNYVFKNNLVSGCTTFVSSGNSGAFAAGGLSNNVYANATPGGNSPYYYGAAVATLASWKSLTGQDANSVQVSSAGATSDGHLAAGSPAIGVGANLSSVGISGLLADKDSVARGSTWDVGAYEYTGGGSSPSTFTVSVASAGTGSGTVTSNTGGINCGSTCTSSTLTSGTSVTLTAIAASGSTFSGWSGACSGTGACAVSVTSNLSVTATFAAVPDTTAPTVSVSAPSAGATVSGSSVALSATASDNVGVAGVQFKLDGANLGSELTTAPYSGSWNTVGVSNGSHTLIAVARDAAGNTKTSASVTVTVSNTLPTFALTVTKSGTGAGTITSNTGGINCGSTCAVSLTSGTSVTLTAAANSGSSFLGWGGACSGTGTCVKAISSATAVSATFGLAADTSAPSTPTGIVPSSVTQTGATLSWLAATDNVAVTGYKVFKNGVQIASPTTNSYAITGLTANTLYTFTVSAYDAAGNESSLSLPLSITTAAIPVTTFTLSASKSGTGSGTVTGNGLNCGSTCSVSITSGTAVTLTATPSADSTFDGWSGACSNTSGTCVTTVTAAKSVSAVFTLIPVSTPVTPPASGGGGGGGGSSGGGSVVSSPTGIFTPTVPQAPVVSTPVKGTGITLTKNLYQGLTDPEVTTLQKYLISQNLLTGTATGYFGPLTEAAVVKYQISKGISATGTVGPLTRASLAGGGTPAISVVTSPSSGSIPAFTRSMTIGATGSDVKYLQIFLNKHGFQVSLSGAGSPNNETTLFGPATTRALAKFQLAKGISPAVGFFGPLTMKTVNSIK